VAPSGLYARLCHAFLVFYFLSSASFLMISRRQIISGSAGPIFAIFTLNESVLGVDDRSGPLFSISQGTLPWQPILCKKMATYPLSSLWHSEMEWNIAFSICALTAQMKPVQYIV